MRLPTESNPATDKVGIWQLQNWLLCEAEARLGARDTSKLICQPDFAENGPLLMNSKTSNKVWAVLSRNSENWWPTAVYELAHETVHLLNPVKGFTNWLEEGVAVEFSLHAQLALGLNVYEPTNGVYFEALQLANQLPKPVLDSAKLARGEAGSLGSVKHEDLKKLFPSMPNGTIKKLISTCIPNET